MCVKLPSEDLNLGPYSPHIVEWPLYQICAVVNGIFSNGNGHIKFFFFFEKPDWKFGIAWALLIKPQ